MPISRSGGKPLPSRAAVAQWRDTTSPTLTGTAPFEKRTSRTWLSVLPSKIYISSQDCFLLSFASFSRILSAVFLLLSLSVLVFRVFLSPLLLTNRLFESFPDEVYTCSTSIAFFSDI